MSAKIFKFEANNEFARNGDDSLHGAAAWRCAKMKPHKLPLFAKIMSERDGKRRSYRREILTMNACGKMVWREARKIANPCSLVCSAFGALLLAERKSWYEKCSRLSPRCRSCWKIFVEGSTKFSPAVNHCEMCKQRDFSVPIFHHKVLMQRKQTSADMSSEDIVCMAVFSTPGEPSWQVTGKRHRMAVCSVISLSWSFCARCTKSADKEIAELEQQRLLSAGIVGGGWNGLENGTKR